MTTSGTTTEGDRVFTFESTLVDQLTVQYRQIDSHAGWVTYGAQIQDLHVTLGQGDTIQLPAGAGIEATVASATSDSAGGTVLQAGTSVLTLPHVDPGTVSADWFIQAPEALPVLSLSLVNPHLVEGLDNSLEAIVSRSSGVTLEFYPPPSRYLAGADDFTNHMAPETVTFAPGETSKTVSIGVVDDTLHETTGAFLLRLANPVGATLGDSTVQEGSITDDDAPVLAISTATPVLTEGGGEAFRFTVTRVGGDLSIAGTVGVSIQADAAGAHPASADDIVEASAPTAWTSPPGRRAAASTSPWPTTGFTKRMRASSRASPMVCGNPTATFPLPFSPRSIRSWRPSGTTTRPPARGSWC